MKILVCYDGSDTAKEAIRQAKLDAKAYEANVHLVTCFSQTHDVKSQDMDKMEDADRELNILKKEFDNEGIPCEIHLLVSDLEPGERLVQFAGENAMEKIFIGVRRRSKVGKLIFGSTAQYVILEAPCPVVTVK